MVNSKNAFWQALVFTIIVFALGLILGYFLEDRRSNNIETGLINSEINFLDEQLRNRVTADLGIDCNTSVADTFQFADKIYAEALKLEQYDSASKFQGTLKILHKRYDLLRMVLWGEAISLKKNCQTDFHTVVYFFNYDSEDIDNKAIQVSVGRVLADLKEKYSNKILLIPIAANLDLDSINLVARHYNLTQFPAIVVDESKVISGLTSVDELETVVFKTNKQ